MKHWCNNNVIVIALLVIFFPLGLYALWKNQNFKPITKKVISSVCLMLFVFAVILNDEAHSPDQAQPYTIINRADAGFLGRDRYFIHITAPQATNHNQFAQTAIQAAKDIQKQTGANVVAVNLEPSVVSIGEGLSYAIARYAPDGRGLSGKDDWKWQVEAAQKTLQPADILISDIWWENNIRFQRDGCTDEAALKAYILEETGIPLNQVRLPSVNRKSYLF